MGEPVDLLVSVDRFRASLEGNVPLSAGGGHRFGQRDGEEVAKKVVGDGEGGEDNKEGDNEV